MSWSTCLVLSPHIFIHSPTHPPTHPPTHLPPPTTQIGLAQLPLAAVAMRFSTIAWSFLSYLSWPAYLLFACLLFGVLLLCKIACGILVTQWAGKIEERETRKREERHREREKEAAALALMLVAGGGGGGGGETS